MDFVVKGVMIGGFALAAAPAQYRVTGVKTFIVGSNGVVYEKDLGPGTLKTFASLDRSSIFEQQAGHFMARSLLILQTLFSPKQLPTHGACS
jgi:Protein of unknown function (DUF2950)